MNAVSTTYYTEDHEWIRVENGVATVGITNHAQEQLGDLVFVDLPSPGAAVSKGDAMVVVESVKAASDVYSPVSGKVLEVNEDLLASPDKINSDPYGSWMLKVELADKSELDGLLDKEAYEKICK